MAGFKGWKGSGPMPGQVSDFKAVRNREDRRSVNLTWEKATDATGYNVSYGTDREKLYHNHISYNDTALTINSLSTRQAYWFTIESFNENGITVSGKTIKVE